ncbi:MAG: uroporphyrinogen-III C-methyltransferase [Thermodesulfobacteriota bacterium]
MAAGIVYLVGAGPGDPGCLTLRGRDCLARADVVIYDYLANVELLRYAPAHAERVFAGKHGAGPHLLEQDEINRLLVEGARAGKTVVRLKGGDPLVFGRGGEEAEALAAAGQRFEIVPGVTSALAVPAYAGIPVTHRDWVSGVTVLTGHEAPGKRTPGVRWDLIATAGNTIVLLMGVTQLSANLQALLAAGLDPATPVAAIRWGSTARQQVIEATAGTLARDVEHGRLRPPVTVVIGEVVRLRATIAWFERRPLFGRRVLVTRTREQAGALAALLADAGADVVECPAIALVAPESWEPLERALERLETYDWLVFTSANGVERFFARLDLSGRDVRALHAARIAAIGPETARALAARHLRADVVPDEFRAEGLLERLAGDDVRGKRFLLPRAAGARSVLPDSLRAAGAEVDEVTTYRAVTPEESIERLRRILDEAPLDVLTFTSSSTVTSFLGLLDRADPGRGRARIAGARVACIGPITGATAAEHGLHVDVVPGKYTVPALVDAIVEHARRGAAPAAQEVF